MFASKGTFSPRLFHFLGIDFEKVQSEEVRRNIHVKIMPIICVCSCSKLWLKRFNSINWVCHILNFFFAFSMLHVQSMLPPSFLLSSLPISSRLVSSPVALTHSPCLLFALSSSPSGGRHLGHLRYTLTTLQDRVAPDRREVAHKMAQVSECHRSNLLYSI